MSTKKFLDLEGLKTYHEKSKISVNGVEQDNSGAVNLTPIDVGAVYIDPDGPAMPGSPYPINADTFAGMTPETLLEDYLKLDRNDELLPGSPQPTNADMLDGKTVEDIVDEARSYVSNPNLLDNPDFSINQRGDTQYAIGEGAKYFVDRWLGSRYKVNVLEHGIAFAANDGQQTAWVGQRFENFSYLMGKTVTLSLLIDDELVFGTYVFPNKGSERIWTDYTLLEDTIAFAIEHTSSAEFPVVQIWSNTTQTHTIKAVKLELGERQTLAHQDEDGNWVLNDVISAELELIKCRRYLTIYNQATNANILVGSGYSYSNNSALISWNVGTFPKTPTIILNGCYLVNRDHNAANAVLITSVGNPVWSKNGPVSSTVTVSGTTLNTGEIVYVQIRDAGGKIMVSCEP